MKAYLAAGALVALDVLPNERKIVAYGRDGTREFALDETFEHAAVPWLRFPVADAFAKLEPSE